MTHVKQCQNFRVSTLRKHSRQRKTTQQSCQSLSIRSTELFQVTSDSLPSRQQQLPGPPLRHRCMPVLTNTAESAKMRFAPRQLPVHLLLTLSFLHTSPSLPVLHGARTSLLSPLCPCCLSSPIPLRSHRQRRTRCVCVCKSCIIARTHTHLLIS